MSNFNYENVFNATKKERVKSEWIPEKSMMVAKKSFLKNQSAKTFFFVLKEMLFHWAMRVEAYE